MTDVVVLLEYCHASASTVGAIEKNSAGTLFFTFLTKQQVMQVLVK